MTDDTTPDAWLTGDTYDDGYELGRADGYAAAQDEFESRAVAAEKRATEAGAENALQKRQIDYRDAERVRLSRRLQEATGKMQAAETRVRALELEHTDSIAERPLWKRISEQRRQLASLNTWNDMLWNWRDRDRRKIDTTEAEVVRLQGIVEQLPHDPSICLVAFGETGPCTCPKRDAILAAPEKEGEQ